MTPQEYLKNRLETCSRYTLSPEDKKFIEKEGLKEFLRKELSRKKFRKWKLQEPAIERVENALTYCIENNAPIAFRWRFGAYKLWRFKSAPEVDWAEFFAIAHFTEYLAPIIAAHKPGVRLYFGTDNVFVERLNNVSKKDTEAYYQSLEKLLDQFRAHFPENFQMEVVHHRSLFKTAEEFESEFAKTVDEIKEGWREKKDPKSLAAILKSSVMNVRWDGVEDLTDLSDTEKAAKIEQSAMYHDALVAMPTIQAWSKTVDKIHLFAVPFPSAVPVGTTRSSIVRFWVGTGVLSKTGDTYSDKILSITQFEEVQKLPHETVPIDLIPLKNFSSIDVYSQPFDFVHDTIS